ncbi:unnamed protein product, partial [Prorocentrum cordatum]
SPLRPSGPPGSPLAAGPRGPMERSPATADAAAAAASLTAKQLTVEHAGENRTLLLVEGAEAAALAQALSGWLGHSRFYLTRPGDDAIVPLTAALPGGLTLSLHAPPRAGAGGSPDALSGGTASASSLPQAQLAPAAPPARRRAYTAPWAEEGAPPGRRRAPLAGERRGLWRAAPLGLAAGLLAEDPAPLDAGDAGHAADSWRRPHPEAAAAQAPWSDPWARDEGPAEHLESPVLRTDTAGTGLPMAEVEEAVANLDRFSRLSTDLANERTLLAWMRTSMAAFRSTVCFLSLVGGLSYQAARVMMVAACVVSAVSGIRRYSKIKQATFSPVPPREFGRLSIYWFAFLMVTCNLAIAAGMLSPSWAKTLADAQLGWRRSPPRHDVRLARGFGAALIGSGGVPSWSSGLGCPPRHAAGLGHLHCALGPRPDLTLGDEAPVLDPRARGHAPTAPRRARLPGGLGASCRPRRRPCSARAYASRRSGETSAAARPQASATSGRDVHPSFAHVPPPSPSAAPPSSFPPP